MLPARKWSPQSTIGMDLPLLAEQAKFLDQNIPIYKKEVEKNGKARGRKFFF